MRKGNDFEVSKEVYERAKEGHPNQNLKYYYMADKDKNELFDVSILCGYGLYGCMVYEEDGKYWCTYETGSTCD